MDVDKKLGMSLDDLIKKTRKDRPKKPAGGESKKFEKKGKLGVKKSLGKKKEEQKSVRPAGNTSSSNGGRLRGRRVRRVSAAPSVDKKKSRKGSNNAMDTSDSSKKGFSRKVVVRKGPDAPGDNRRKVKITNVPYDLTWKDVKGALSSVGHIERCDVERGEATLTFATHKEAARAIQTYNNGDMNGRKIRVFFI